MSYRADQAARENARRVFDRAMVLEAGAGTGKTSALVDRVVGWCLGPGWARVEAGAVDPRDARAVASELLRRVVAITFTEKAAREMGERIAHAFAQAAPNDPRASWLVEQIDQLRCSTIHGFCNRLLARYPLQAGISPQFTIDESGLLVRAYARQTVGRQFPRLYGADGDADAMLVASAGFGPEEVHATLYALLRHTVPLERLDPQLVGDAAALVSAQRLRSLLASVWAFLEPPLLRARAANGRLKIAPRVLDRCALVDTELATIGSASELVGWARQDGQGLLAKTFAEWGRGRFESLTLQSELASLDTGQRQALAAASLELQSLTTVDLSLFAAGCRLLRPLLQETRERLAAAGVLQFDDLIAHASRLLSGDADVADEVRREIDLLLVDEFQDTDREQCRLIEALALRGAARPLLFLVGDPKQSIYAWRSADLAAYEQFCREVTAGADPDALTVSMRSMPPILDEIRRISAPIFVYQTQLQPRFQPLVPKPAHETEPGFDRHGRKPVEHWISGLSSAGTETKGESRALEALSIAHDIAALWQLGELSLAKTAILMRNTAAQEVITDALRQYQIPFVVEGDRSFYLRREIVDAEAALRAILDPHDQIALVAFLRSVVAGVPDAAWLALWDRGFPSELTRIGFDRHALQRCLDTIDRVDSEIRGALSALQSIDQWACAARHAVQALARLRACFEQAPIDQFLSELRQSLWLVETEAARWSGSQRVANLEQFLRRFQNLLLESGGSHNEVLRALRLAIDEQHAEREAALADESLDAVRVMTIHKAKGLTFEQVYLVALDQESRSTPSPDRFGLHHVGADWALQLFGSPDFDTARLASRRLQIEAAERARMLYVAITRPSQRLVLCYRAGDANEQSLAALLQQREGGLPFDALRANPHGELRDGSVRWRDLDRCEPAAARPPQAPDREASLSTATLQAEWNAWTGTLQRAEQRMSWLRRRAMSGDDAAQHRLDNESQVDLAAPPSLERAVARDLGARFHLVMRQLDPTARDREAAWRRALELVSPIEAPLDQLLQQFRAGPLWERWWLLAPRIIGRELAILASVPEPEAPLALAVGAIDLLYRDEHDNWVIADFKTETTHDPARHALQLTQYGLAVQRAQRLAAPPALEIWSIRHGVVDRIDAV